MYLSRRLQTMLLEPPRKKDKDDEDLGLTQANKDLMG